MYCSSLRLAARVPPGSRHPHPGPLRFAPFAWHLVARLDVRRGVADAQRLLDLIFNLAGHLMPALNVPMRGHHDMEIDPVISPAVPMPQFVVAAYPRLPAVGTKM